MMGARATTSCSIGKNLDPAVALESGSKTRVTGHTEAVVTVHVIPKY
jgi:hypothetical protein